MTMIAKMPLYALVLVLLLLCGCQQEELTSGWRYDDILIDGNPQEWQNASYYHLDDPSVGMALCNDQEFLYLRLTTHDQQLAQQLSIGGLQLWIDPQGKENETLGIKISAQGGDRQGPPPGGGPMGSSGSMGSRGPMGEDSSDSMALNDDAGSGQGQMQGQRPGPEMGDRSNGGPNGNPQEKRELSFELSVDGKVIGGFFAKENRFALGLAQGQQQGGLIYEIKIPLSGELYQGKPEPSASITIGLAASAGQGPGDQQGQGGQGGQGGQQGGGQQGGGGGGKSGGKPGGGQSGGGKPEGGGQSQALDFWFTARLAGPEA